VRDEGILSLEQAIHKMTAQPAHRINLTNRGILEEGKIADINIFDPETVKDSDDWAKPHQYATGFSYVIVGGTPVIDNGTRTDAFPGRVLKRDN
jgi:N-acyl-D-amino-acid deacylase